LASSLSLSIVNIVEYKIGFMEYPLPFSFPLSWRGRVIKGLASPSAVLFLLSLSLNLITPPFIVSWDEGRGGRRSTFSPGTS